MDECTEVLHSLLLLEDTLDKEVEYKEEELIWERQKLIYLQSLQCPDSDVYSLVLSIKSSEGVIKTLKQLLEKTFEDRKACEEKLRNNLLLKKRSETCKNGRQKESTDMNSTNNCVEVDPELQVHCFHDHQLICASNDGHPNEDHNQEMVRKAKPRKIFRRCKNTIWINGGGKFRRKINKCSYTPFREDSYRYVRGADIIESSNTLREISVLNSDTRPKEGVGESSHALTYQPNTVTFTNATSVTDAGVFKPTLNDHQYLSAAIKIKSNWQPVLQYIQSPQSSHDSRGVQYVEHSQKFHLDDVCTKSSNLLSVIKRPNIAHHNCYSTCPERKHHHGQFQSCRDMHVVKRDGSKSSTLRSMNNYFNKGTSHYNPQTFSAQCLRDFNDCGNFGCNHVANIDNNKLYGLELKKHRVMEDCGSLMKELEPQDQDRHMSIESDQHVSLISCRCYEVCMCKPIDEFDGRD